ncbi:MAG: hypothetical protein ACOZAK_03315 [Patescibacteria group bacterium]
MSNKEKFFSVVKKEREEVEEKSGKLNDYGQVVRSDLFSLLEDQKLLFDQNLLEDLRTSFSTYPSAIFNQLGFLLEKPLLKTHESQNGHWSYELSMIKVVLRFAEEIKANFSGDNSFIADLVFMVAISDIGKAGPVLVESSNEPAAVIRRIYNHCLFTKEHRDWLLACDPASFPEDLQPALATISRETTPTGLSDFDLIFKNGVFFALPIELYLYVLRQVALEKVKNEPKLLEQDPDLGEKITATFSLTTLERDFLISIGNDPQAMPIRRFFTRSHVLFGDLFFQRGGFLTPDQASLVPMAMSHHFSQDNLSLLVDREQIITDQKWIKQCALLEILDKFTAYYSRWHGEDRQKSIDATFNEVMNNLQKNYSDYSHLKDWYEEVFVWMSNVGIFTWFDN